MILAGDIVRSREGRFGIALSSCGGDPDEPISTEDGWSARARTLTVVPPGTLCMSYLREQLAAAESRLLGAQGDVAAVKRAIELMTAASVPAPEER
jgi:hypothetical protein